jgi:pilus assembly protein CpaB
MRFDRRFLIVMALSLLWALLVSAVFYRLARGPRAGAAYSGNQKSLVVAVRPLPLGDMVTRDSVRTRSVPGDLFPKGAFSNLEDVLNRPVISPILPDEPVMDTRLASRGAGLGLAPMIPDGMRAISVRVNDVVGVAGFILPGMHVDVLSTGRAVGRDEVVTRTVLENITVLSAGQTVQVDARSQSINTAVVTLLVRPDQAEALALANSEGRIQLVLRNSGDRQPAHTRGRQLHELFAAPSEPSPRTGPSERSQRRPERKPPEPARAPAIVHETVPTQVVIWNGAKSSVFTFPSVEARQ